MDETITWEDLPRFMAEVRVKARSLLKSQKHLVSLQTTELVDSAVRRVLQTAHEEASDATWENRDHFLATLYLAMRSAVIDHARRRLALLRDARQTTHLEDLQWSELPQAVEQAPEQVLALHEVLELLEKQCPEWATIAKYRLLGLTEDEIAEVRGVSRRTVTRAWREAKYWCDEEILRRVNEV
jgi:DNA-directed RNA polymerase specialized sigma24 family protein